MNSLLASLEPVQEVVILQLFSRLSRRFKLLPTDCIAVLVRTKLNTGFNLREGK